MHVSLRLTGSSDTQEKSRARVSLIRVYLVFGFIDQKKQKFCVKLPEYDILHFSLIIHNYNYRYQSIFFSILQMSTFPCTIWFSIYQ